MLDWFDHELEFETTCLKRFPFLGTSLEAIRSVILSEKICVLNLHPQSLRILKNSDLMPFIVFVAPPSMEKLKRWKLDRSEPVADEELKVRNYHVVKTTWLKFC